MGGFVISAQIFIFGWLLIVGEGVDLWNLALRQRKDSESVT